MKTRSDRMWRWAMVAALGVMAFAMLRGVDGAAHADHAAQAARATTVAVLDFGQALDQLDERRDREKELEQLGGDVFERIERLRGQRDAVMADLEMLAGTAQFEEKQVEAIRLEGQLELENRIAQRTVQKRRMQMQLELFNKITEAATRFAQREGYDLVLSSDASDEIPLEAADRMQPEAFMGALASRRVIHAEGTIDITDEVATMMNLEYRAP